MLKVIDRVEPICQLLEAVGLVRHREVIDVLARLREEGQVKIAGMGIYAHVARHGGHGQSRAV